jgi:hypothetical protein
MHQRDLDAGSHHGREVKDSEEILAVGTKARVRLHICGSISMLRRMFLVRSYCDLVIRLSCVNTRRYAMYFGSFVTNSEAGSGVNVPEVLTSKVPAEVESTRPGIGKNVLDSRIFLVDPSSSCAFSALWNSSRRAGGEVWGLDCKKCLSIPGEGYTSGCRSPSVRAYSIALEHHFSQ